jgi:hypothetical protein
MDMGVAKNGFVSCAHARVSVRPPHAHGRTDLFAQRLDHRVLLPELLHQVLALAAARRERRCEVGRHGATHLGAERGLRPSTTHWCPLFLQRLQTVASAGKSHFILSFLQCVHAPGLA